jgi:hypothetical protein
MLSLSKHGAGFFNGLLVLRSGGFQTRSVLPTGMRGFDPDEMTRV